MTNQTVNYINKKAFGKRLKELLQANQETFYSLAEVVHLSPSTICRYARGEMSPKITTIEIIARYFNVSPAWLMGYETDIDKDIAEETAGVVFPEEVKVSKYITKKYGQNGYTLLKIIENLNENGQKEALKRVERLSKNEKFARSQQ